MGLPDKKIWRHKNVWKVTSGDSTVILRSYLGHAFIINHEYFHKTFKIELILHFIPNAFRESCKKNSKQLTATSSN